MTERKRVLVVDDEERWREHVSETVRACGHLPTTAKDELDAEGFLDTESFDLIITDNFMRMQNGGMNLLEREWLLGKELPSILHTSELMPEQEARLKDKLPHVVPVIKSYSGNEKLKGAIEKLLPLAS